MESGAWKVGQPFSSDQTEGNDGIKIWGRTWKKSDWWERREDEKCSITHKEGWLIHPTLFPRLSPLLSIRYAEGRKKWETILGRLRGKQRKIQNGMENGKESWSYKREDLFVWPMLGTLRPETKGWVVRFHVSTHAPVRETLHDDPWVKGECGREEEKRSPS